MSKLYKNTYFPHDNNAREDRKIKNLLSHFRKESELKAQAAVCIYWWIIEDMHSDDYPVDNLEAFADNYRCDIEFLKSILNDFDLFHQENGFYVSNRVIKNQTEQEEKRKRRQKAAYFRWKNDKNNIVDQIIQIYNSEFDKELIVSEETKAKIEEITKANKLNLDIWQKVFHNAQRGWNIGGKNKKPSLQNILDKWDSFANDDYFLAPDTKKIQQEKAAEQEKRQQERAEAEKERAAYQREREEVHDTATAIAFLNKYFALPENALSRSNVIKEYMDKYSFTVKDILNARKENK